MDEDADIKIGIDQECLHGIDSPQGSATADTPTQWKLGQKATQQQKNREDRDEKKLGRIYRPKILRVPQRKGIDVRFLFPHS